MAPETCNVRNFSKLKLHQADYQYLVTCSNTMLKLITIHNGFLKKKAKYPFPEKRQIYTHINY